MWHIRKPSGDIYGPVDLLVLVRWAADGRVASGDEVSQDQRTWKRAEALAELELHWMIEPPGGKPLGPFHALALRGPYRDGNLPAGINLRHRTDGTVATVGDTLLKALLAETDRLAAEEQKLLQSLRSQKAELARLAERPESAPAAPAAGGKAPEQAARIQELEAELAATAARAKESEEARAAAEQSFREQVAALEAQVAAGSAGAGDAKAGPASTDTVSEAYSELAEGHDRLLARLQEMSSEYQAAREAKAEAERLAGELTRKAEEAAEAAEARAVKAVNQLQDLEKKHFDLVKSYRELNDRFIQLRQKVRETEAPGEGGS